MAAIRTVLLVILVGATTFGAGPTTPNPALSVTSANEPGTLGAAPHRQGHARSTRMPTSLTPELTVTGNQQQQAAVDEAATTFATIGMELPDLRIRFHDDEGPCDGHLGMFRPRRQGWAIDVCSTLAFVVPHELGHAWEHASLTVADRQQYMQARGFETWRNHDRRQSGLEDLAFVVQLVVLGGGHSSRPAIDSAFDLLMELAT